MTESEVFNYSAVAGLLLLAGLGVLLFRFGEYRLGRHEVEVLLFDRVIRRVPLFDINEVEVGARFPCELWPSRWLVRGRFLTIRRKTGLLKSFVICPRQPEKLRESIYYALGWNPAE